MKEGGENFVGPFRRESFATTPPANASLTMIICTIVLALLCFLIATDRPAADRF